MIINGTLGGTFTSNTSPIGAGGYVVGFDQSTDGLLMTHNPDVTVPLIRTLPTDTKWRWMLSPSSLQPLEYDPVPTSISLGDGGIGCAGTRIAPSNKNIIYSFLNSRMMKSTNGAAAQPAFDRCAMGEFYSLQNAGTPRYANPLIDIHPTNPNIVLIGTPHSNDNVASSGVFYTTDGGVTRTKITGLPAALARGPDPDRNLVGIDPGDPTKGYVHVGGIGLYPLTITAGGVMTAGALIAGSPVRCGHLVMTGSGDVFVAAGGADGGVQTNDLYKLTRAGVATNYTTGCGIGAMTVAVNPFNELIIFVADNDQRYKGSFDGGATWKEYYPFSGGFTNIVGEVKWLGDRGSGGVFAGKLMFDRAVPNKLWLSHGLGIGFIMTPTTNVANQLQLSDFSAGNEEKVAASFLSVSGKPIPILGNWDFSLWKMNSLTAFTNTGIVPPYNGSSNGLAIAKDLDYASNSGRIVAAMAQVAGSNVYSDTDGDNWNLIPGQAGAGWGQGGAIAMNTNQQIIVLESNNGLGRWTNNFGTTWNNIQLVPGVDTGNFINANYTVRHAITADKTRSGVFALVYTIISGNGYGETKGGLWVTENSGQTWDQKIIGVIGGGSINGTGVPAGRDPRQFWACRLEYIPGYTGEMLYTAHSEPLYTEDPLFHITGDGTTTTVLGAAYGLKKVQYFDFGPVAKGQTRPTVGFYGYVNGVQGVYITHDWFATVPKLVKRFPMENLSPVTMVGCDRNKFGRVFVGGIGWNHYDSEHAILIS